MWGAIAAAAASLIGSGISAISARRNARRVRDTERENIRQQNEYNSPFAQLGRLAQAGISPVGQNFENIQQESADTSGMAQMLGNESQALGQMSQAPFSAVSSALNLETAKNTRENTRFLIRSFQDRLSMNHWQAKDAVNKVEGFQYQLRALNDQHQLVLQQIEGQRESNIFQSYRNAIVHPEAILNEKYATILLRRQNEVDLERMIENRFKGEQLGYAYAYSSMFLESVLMDTKLDKLNVIKSTLETQLATLKAKAVFDNKAQNFANDNQFWRQINDMVTDVISGWSSVVNDVSGIIGTHKSLSLAKKKFDWQKNIYDDKPWGSATSKYDGEGRLLGHVQTEYFR